MPLGETCLSVWSLWSFGVGLDRAGLTLPVSAALGSGTSACPGVVRLRGKFGGRFCALFDESQRAGMEPCEEESMHALLLLKL